MGRQLAAIPAHDRPLAVVAFAGSVERSIRQPESPPAGVGLAHRLVLCALAGGTAPRFVHSAPVLGARHLRNIVDVFGAGTFVRTLLQHAPPCAYVRRRWPPLVPGQLVDSAGCAVTTRQVLGMAIHVRRALPQWQLLIPVGIGRRDGRDSGDDLEPQKERLLVLLPDPHRFIHVDLVGQVGSGTHKPADLLRRIRKVPVGTRSALGSGIGGIAVVTDDGVIVGGDHLRSACGEPLGGFIGDHDLLRFALALELLLHEIFHVIVVLDQSAHEVAVGIEPHNVGLGSAAGWARPSG